tara:strand:- start:31 stop:228 length:198 start_codon:yes stop_codon:yes gene_type:complete
MKVVHYLKGNYEKNSYAVVAVVKNTILLTSSFLLLNKKAPSTKSEIRNQKSEIFKCEIWDMGYGI